MIRSMTAFARHESQTAWGRVTWELRSVNHRYLEIALRLPEAFRVLEPTIREHIGKQLKRGKVDCTLKYQPGDDALTTITLNQSLARRVVQVADEVKPLLGANAQLALIDVLRWPGVVSDPEPDLDPLKDDILAQLDQALSELVATRKREGQRMHGMVAQRCALMAEQVTQVRQRRPEVLLKQREKLLARLEEIVVEVDPGRLEQELAIIAQRLDVDEELDRLDAHLSEISDVLTRSESVGRRLDFLMQELNREANTLSSKSADTQTTRAAVELKVLIEQMREQVQNIE